MLGFYCSFSKTWYLEEVLQVFQDRSLLGRDFRGSVLPILEYCSAVWCSAADTHLKLLDRVVSGARFLIESVFEYDIAHRRSVAVLCMLYKIRCNPCTLFWCSTWAVCASAGYTQCSSRSQIGILIRLLAAESCSTAGP